MVSQHIRKPVDGVDSHALLLHYTGVSKKCLHCLKSDSFGHSKGTEEVMGSYESLLEKVSDVGVNGENR